MPVTLEKKDTFEIRRATWEEIQHTDYVNPPMVLLVNDVKVADLSIGSDDNYQIFYSKELIYVVADNTRLGYASLEIFRREDNEQLFSHYASGEDYDNDNMRDMGFKELKAHMLQWWQD